MSVVFAEGIIDEQVVDLPFPYSEGSAVRASGTGGHVIVYFGGAEAGSSLHFDVFARYIGAHRDFFAGGDISAEVRPVVLKQHKVEVVVFVYGHQVEAENGVVRNRKPVPHGVVLPLNKVRIAEFVSLNFQFISETPGGEDRPDLVVGDAYGTHAVRCRTRQLYGVLAPDFADNGEEYEHPYGGKELPLCAFHRLGALK